MGGVKGHACTVEPSSSSFLGKYGALYSKASTKTTGEASSKVYVEAFTAEDKLGRDADDGANGGSCDANRGFHEK
ncbi:hypothetical protein V6N12_042345 [Hibiscus sabdariffa]|uniref:Uncharacterized protein n=1 Tax=Hibiscus sabdariffa TaxID=183260 RepID=A0ABR2EEI0_9ROSI